MTHENGDGDDVVEVARWRRAERKRQLERRRALEARLRFSHTAEISAHLEAAVGEAAGITVSFYWPIRGEPDLRELMNRIISHGGQCALPVVIERARPLVFRTWQSGEPLERGFWNIPVPSGGVEVVPDVVIAPLVAFDRDCYRLGYGGGYFDRTLCSMTGNRRVFGVGYALCEVETIFPQSHDVPMNAIVTESGILQAASKTT